MCQSLPVLLRYLRYVAGIVPERVLGPRPDRRPRLQHEGVQVAGPDLAEAAGGGEGGRGRGGGGDFGEPVDHAVEGRLGRVLGEAPRHPEVLDQTLVK